jgi:hypothetical protein
MTDRHNRVFKAAALVLSLNLTACANLPDIASTSKPRDAASLGLDNAQASKPVTEQWWREFGDEQQAFRSIPGWP